MADMNFEALDRDAFLDACIARGVSFALDGDKLRVFGDALEAPLLAAIRARKGELTAWLQSQQARQDSAETAIVPAARGGNRFPLSFSQQRVWFIDRMEGGSAHYNMPGAFRIRGEFSEDLAEQALAQVIARHEVLRAAFHDSEEGPCQSIRADVAFTLVRRDLSALDAAAREAALQEAVDDDARRPFQLATDLLLRAAFLRVAPDEGMLLLNMHHIASDGWSVGVLVKEFARNYEALRQGVADPLPALPIQYVDYAAWQRSPEQSARAERQLAHWKDVLAGCPRIHGLPLDKPRPAQQNFKARSVDARIDAALAARLNKLAREQDATLFMLLQSAFALLLSRWSGEQDIVLAVPVAGRTRTELEPLIGFFINTLVFRTDLSGQPTFKALLQRAKDYALDAYSHQDVPFELLVDALRPERDLSYNPLCQVKFLLQNHEAQSFAMPGMQLDAVACADEYIRFDLDLTISETLSGELFLKWTYKEDLFEAATIERLAAAYASLLDAVTDNVAAPVAQLALFDEAGRAAWMAQACGAEQPAGRELTVVASFEAAAAAHGGAIALRHGDLSMSFAQLNAKANRLAHYLIEQGVGAGQRIGIYVERSPELMVAILGVLKSGAAYVPFEPKNTRERLGRIIADAGIEWVLAQPGMADRLPSGGIDLMMLDAACGEGWLGEYPDHNPGEDIPLAHSAYVIYTSGSTGAPKGVEITHGGLADYCAYASGRYYEDGLAGSLVVTSHGFDITVPSLFLPLLRGGAVQFLEAGDELADLAARLGGGAAPALLRMTPMHVRGLLELLPEGPVAARHVFVVGGEAFTVSLARQLQERFPNSQLYNHYGPTETVVGCAMFDISANIDRLGRVLPIGRPMDNTRLYVLNEALQPCPAGVAGELHIGGLGVAKGYLNQPQLTAEKFIADPFMPGQRLYKTGDLVRKNATGDLEFIARIDDQVKLRGYRIELGEIRAALLAQDAVREAVVIVAGEGEHKRLAAYLVAATPVADEGVFTDAVQARLKQALPDYMVPGAYRLLDALPLSANGKIDLRALPAIAAGSANGHVAPRNETEAALCAIWQQLLKVEQVGVHDNFFALGGDSILSIQVVARANQAGLGITTRQLFAHQSVAELAQHAGAARREAGQGAVTGPISLLPVQRQFLAHDVHHAHYNQSVLLEAPAGLDAAMLEQIVAALYRRHDALRMTVAQVDGAWQAHHAGLTPELLAAAVVVETLPAEGQSAFIGARCAALQAGFDPASGPLLRALLLQSAPGADGGRLFLCAHHLVVDGVSWRILLADLEQACKQLRAGEKIALAPKSTSFQQWSEAMAGLAESASLAAQLPFWLAQFETPVASLPQQNLRRAPQASTRSVRFALDAAETASLLKNCSQRYRTRIDELLLAGVCIGMRAWTGSDGVRLTLEGHGREELFDEIDTSQTVGWFTSTYPLALGAASAADTGATIRQVKEQLRAVPQRGIGYGLLRHLAGNAELAAAELAHPAQLMFNYLGQFDASVGADQALRAAFEPTGDAIDPRRLRHCPLGLNGKVAGGVLDFTLDYSELQFERAQAEQLAQMLAAGLREVIAHCAGAAPDLFTPSDFPLAQVGAAELDAWQRQYPIARLYPATSMQQGMLFHSMLDSGAYVTQTYPVLVGELDMACFRAAWEAVTQRHDIFRTVFVGQGEHLHQLVAAQAALPWAEHDWRALDPAQQAARFEQLRLDDRARGFDFAQAPLQRISMFRLGETRYQMLWTHHHMLLDGWCTPLVYRDVMDAYRRLRAGQAPDASVVPPYENYIGWLARQDRGQARQYWRDYLDGIAGPTALRLARPEAGEDGEQKVVLDAADTARLAQFARQHHTTVNTVFQLAWGYLLHCYSGEQDVVFGTTISGRPAELAGVEEMVGLFINTVPVRVGFGASRQVGDLLDGLHHAFQSSTAFGYLPLTEIVQCSGVSGAASLFDSLVVFENYPLDAALKEDQQNEVRMEALGSFIANGYGITLNVNSGPSTRISCCYSGKLLDAGAARALLGHLKTVLLAMAGGAASIDAVCLLEADERQRMLVEWNATERTWPDARAVHLQFEDSAARHAAAVAVRHGAHEMSYAQLNAKANRLAHYLIEQGVGTGQRIGIYVERSPELMVAILGVLKSGAAYVPFEPKNTRERLGRIIADAGIEWVLAQPGMADRLPSGGIDLMMLDDAGGEGWLEEYPDHNPGLPCALDDSAYIIYTSGSTGAPKGVDIAHGGLMDYCNYASGRYYAAGLAGSLVVTSHGFDITVPSLYLPLLRGGAVQFLAAGEELPDLAAQLARPDCPPSLLRMTPMHVRGLLELLPPSAPVAGRHVFVVGGEAFTVSLARELQARCPGSALYNHYGPTETVVGCAMFDISANLDTLGRVLPIGRPMANTRLYVLDGALQPCPPGVAGELHIGGAGVAKGYLNQPQLTAAKFIADPFVPGARLYKTGDLVRFLPGGDIEFIARVDDQVKLRGYRIELGEIRAALLAQEEVHEAVVLVAGEGEDKRLTACLVAHAHVDDEAAFVQAVQARLKQALPDYMVPAAYALMPHLPLTANGKIDQKSLLTLAGLLAPQQAYLAPASATEVHLAQIWQALLGVEKVSASANFFDIGGHSLLAMRLINAIQTEFGVACSLKALLANPTIVAMASQIDLSVLKASNLEGANSNENNIETEW